jgi:hypothetical protein
MVQVQFLKNWNISREFPNLFLAGTLLRRILIQRMLKKKTYKSKVTKNALLNEDLNQYDPDNLINEIDRNYREVTQQE